MCGGSTTLGPARCAMRIACFGEKRALFARLGRVGARVLSRAIGRSDCWAVLSPSLHPTRIVDVCSHRHQQIRELGSIPNNTFLVPHEAPPVTVQAGISYGFPNVCGLPCGKRATTPP